jgi:hypothetical protein
MKKKQKTAKRKSTLYGCEHCDYESSKKKECCGDMMQPKKST